MHRTMVTSIPARQFRARIELLLLVALGCWVLSGCDRLLGLDGHDRVATPALLPSPMDAGSGADAAAHPAEDAGIADHGEHSQPTDAGLSRPPAATAPECTQYCAKVQAQCTGSESQFKSDPSSCLALASYMDPSLCACRLQALDESSCSSAGPAGIPNPGEPASCNRTACEAYCTLLAAVCPSAGLYVTDEPPFATDIAECMQVCRTVPLVAPYAVDPTSPSGNILNCRVFHINLAAEKAGDAVLYPSHCEHAVGRKGTFATPPCQ